MATETLDDRIAEARAHLDRLERMKASKSCAEGHSWVSIGGCNASCDHRRDDCQCSVPVHECSVCGDCDYGDNDEGRQLVSECAALWGEGGDNGVE